MSLSKDTAAKVSAAERSPFVLEDVNAYRAWRDRKLAGFPKSVDELIVPVADGKNLGDAEYSYELGPDGMWRDSQGNLWVSNSGALDPPYTLALETVGDSAAPAVGGKAQNLAIAGQALGLPVPEGWASEGPSDPTEKDPV